MNHTTGEYYQDTAESDRQKLSKEVEALRQKLGLRQADVSQESGVNASMLSQWMLGRYKGNVARINGLMDDWLVRKRGGVPMIRPNINGKSPLHKRKEEQRGRKPNVQKLKGSSAMISHRKAFSYPKIPSNGLELVPIRLNIEIHGQKLVDSFTWNIYEQDHSYESFAFTLVQDLDYPDYFLHAVAASIKEQVEKARKNMPWYINENSESLHPIRIAVRIKDTIVYDQFEWDLNNSRNSPEKFAHNFCCEMGLSGEFETYIALSIREQLITYSQLIRSGYGDKVSKLEPVTIALRDIEEATEWSPKIRYLLAEDMRYTQGSG